MVDSSEAAIAEGVAEGNGTQMPGARLRAARQSAGLEVADVARQLNLLEWQVDALEQDHYEKFPADLFVKGHLSSYARLLKLDVAPVLNAYHLQRPRPVSRGRSKSEPRRPLSLDNATRQRRYWGLVATALVVAALWGWHQKRERAELLPLTAEAATLEEVPALGGIDVALAGGGESLLLDSVQLVSAPAVAPTIPLQGEGRNPVTDDAPVAALADGDRLSLRFSADCWVEIKDRDNKLLVAVLKHADDELKVEGRGPFKVLLGYAPGVEMAYNGTPVKVDAPDSSRSARIIVGNS